MTLERSRRLVNGVWRYVTASENGGGGSQTLKVVRVPIAFDTENLAVQSFPQVSAAQATSTFVIAGDQTALFPAGGGLTSTSDLNSGAYTVVSSSFGGGNTTIVVGESVADEGATGDIINAGNGVTGSGIEVYVPAAGELWQSYASYLSIPTAWDGSTPKAWLYQEGAADYQNSLALVSSVDLTTADSDATVEQNGSITEPVTTFTTAADPVQLFNAATPLRIVVDDGNGGAPGSGQGEGEIVLFIVPAAA